MKYAIVNGDLQEAQPDLSGICKHCGSPTIAKCGRVKVGHWAHKSKVNCDSWHEPETPWHREWKGHFPKECQEVTHFDTDGKIHHIADVKVDNAFVLEFQHSPIKNEDRVSRESFYRDMLWIIDGCRRQNDKEKFLNFVQNLQMANLRSNMKSTEPDRKTCPLIRDWGNSKVSVFFDFGDDMLWGLIPLVYKSAVRKHFFQVDRNELIDSLQPGQQLKKFINLVRSWAKTVSRR